MIKNNFWERLFPVKRDFYRMISDQAKATNTSIEILRNWLTSRSKEDYELLFKHVDSTNKIRLNMEHNLIEAFVTPFDRQDIYSLSVEMNRIVEYAKSTLEEMEAFKIDADETIIKMVQQLNMGAGQLATGITLLKTDSLNTQEQIAAIRNVQLTVENCYRSGMVLLFNSDNVMYAMKYREVYHHIKDAVTHLGYTADVLHKIVVRVV